MSGGYCVKGSTLNTKFAFVRERFGPRAEQLMIARCEAGLFPILDGNWYPYATYVALLERIAEVHFDGHAAGLVEVGKDSAERALTTVYQAFVRDEPFPEFLGRIAALHRLFYSRGRIEVTLRPDGGGCEIRHRDKPAVAEADLYVALGFYLRAAELHGLAGARGDFSIETGGARFAVAWD